MFGLGSGSCLLVKWCKQMPSTVTITSKNSQRNQEEAVAGQ